MTESRQRRMSANEGLLPLPQHEVDLHYWRTRPRWPVTRTFMPTLPGALTEAEMTRVAGSAMWVPSKQWFTIVGGDLPCVVQLLVEFDGTASRCTDIRCAATETQRVTATMLRHIPVDELFRVATNDFTQFYKRAADGSFAVTSFEREVDPQTVQRAFASSRRTRIEELQHASAVYLRALATGQHPTAAVERELGLPNRNTAKKRVQQARTAGLLGPARGERKAGINTSSAQSGRATNKETD